MFIQENRLLHFSIEQSEPIPSEPENLQPAVEPMTRAEIEMKTSERQTKRDILEKEESADRQEEAVTLQILETKLETREELQAKIDELNERLAIACQNMPAGLAFSPLGAVMTNTSFHLHPDGRTSARHRPANYEETYDPELAAIVNRNSDPGYHAIGMSDGIHMFRDIQWLEGMVEEYEALVGVPKNELSEEDIRKFDEEHQIRQMTGLLEEDIIDLENIPEVYQKEANAALQARNEWKAVMESMPEGFSESNIGKVMQGVEVVLLKNGNMAISFAEESNPSFHQIYDVIFANITGYTRNYGNQYVIEVDSSGIDALLQVAQRLFVQSNGEENQTAQSITDTENVYAEDKQTTSIEKISDEKLGILQKQIDEVVLSYDANVPEYLQDFDFATDENGRLYFTYAKPDAVQEFLASAKNSPHGAVFSDIILEEKDGTVSSSTLSEFQVNYLIQYIQQEQSSALNNDTK